MRGLLLWCAAIGGVTVGSWQAQGQQPYGNVRGMFGDRVLGDGLSPRPSTFGGGIVTGPAGEFRGRGRTEGMRFSNMPWQYPVGVEPLPGVMPRSFVEAIPWGLLPRPLPYRPGESPAEASVPPRAAPEPAELPPEPAMEGRPEQWFRTPSPAAETGAPSAPAVGPQAPAGDSSAIQPPTVRMRFAASQFAGSPAASAADSIRRSDRIRKLSPITVTMQNETAVLRGRVASEHDRQLAEAVARLEPGIWRVRNELTVAPAASVSASPGYGRQK